MKRLCSHFGTDGATCTTPKPTRLVWYGEFPELSTFFMEDGAHLLCETHAKMHMRHGANAVPFDHPKARSWFTLMKLLKDDELES